MTDVPPARSLSLEQQVTLLSGEGFWRTQSLPDARIPSVVVSDGPHGLRFQSGAGDELATGGSERSTCFPTAATLACSWDEQLVTEIGAAIGLEARALGVDVVLGPGMNIKRHPLGGRNFEYFSEDPRLAGRLAAAMVTGIQSRGVGACLKHFAVNNQESHRFVVDAVVDERSLREIYLSAFEHAVTVARPWTVMASYNLVNGVNATDNHRLLTAILREEWGFDGLVMSDWGATNDRVAAVAAGMDLEMPGSRGLSDRVVLDAVGSGRLRADLVATSAQRVLDLVARVPGSEPAGLPAEEHDALARRSAAESTVLLTNDGILPLGPGRTLAVIGAFADRPRYQGSGSSRVNPTRVTTTLDALRARGISFTYAPGYDPAAPRSDDALIADAVDVAAHADVALVMAGLPDAAESEGMDRRDLGLAPQHDALVAAVAAANPRTVVALSNGAPVLMPWKDAPAAILESYLGGQAGGAALVDVLYGDAEPGGRLAETFPAALDAVACDPYFPGQPHQVQYREGIFVGYRHATSAGPTPLFAFGHGLGYTTIRWEEIDVDRTSLAAGDGVAVTLTVTNTGPRPGTDVVQIYLHDRSGVVLRPRRELAGFAKVRLEAGESRAVRVDVPARAFAYYDVVAADWRTPSGPYDLEIARSSADIVATRTVVVTGGVDTAPEPADTPAVASTDELFVRRLGGPIPPARPTRPFTRDSTLEEISATRVGKAVKDLLWRVAPLGDEVKADPSGSAMIEHGFRELPLRAVAIFSGGKLTWTAVDALVDVLNGRSAHAASSILTGAVTTAKRRLPTALRSRLP